MGDSMSEEVQEVDTMNVDDSISKGTVLFGLIAESASTNRLFVLVNKMMKTNTVDGMIIPMNIREDDFYFTLVNMKKSHVNGVYIAKEFQSRAVELLDSKEEEVEVYNRCDLVIRSGEKLHGFLLEKNNVESLEELATLVYEKIVKV